ncbi:hypothetical protein OROHE_003048 [Orobanche hederae]
MVAPPPTISFLQALAYDVIIVLKKIVIVGKCLGGKILALPLDYPLAKALLRLEFLLDRVQSVQETVAKFTLSV